MKILNVLVFIMFCSTSSLFSYLAENDSKSLYDIDNPAALNILSYIEVSQDLFYNDIEEEIFLYRQQVVLPKFLIIKTGFYFYGEYDHHSIYFNDYKIYLSTGLWKIFNVGIDYSEEEYNLGFLLNLKYFSVGAKILNVDFDEKNNIKYDNYYLGLSLLFPFSKFFQTRIYIDYIDTPERQDVIHAGINEIFTLNNCSFTFKQNMFFDKDFLQYNFSGQINLKGISIYYESERLNSSYKNRIGVKFYFDNQKTKSSDNDSDNIIFILENYQDEQKIVFELFSNNKKDIRYWRIDIINDKKEIVKTINSVDKMPDLISWDYTDSFGKEISAGSYIARLSVIDKNEKMTSSNQLNFIKK